MKNRLLVVFACLVVAGLIVSGYLFYTGGLSGLWDKRLQKALNAVQSPHSYEMFDTTHATLSGRTIDIVGLYTLDLDARRFQSVSTTTLTLLDERAPKNTHSFTLQHRSIGDDVYVLIDTASPLLRKTIPYSSAWQHFKADAIPERYVDIAVPGPILDNLALLGSGGGYLSPSGKTSDRTMASTTYHVYPFRLSPKTAEVTVGPLKSLIDLIATGTVEVWVDDTPSVRMMHISADGYVSTTTILGVNTPLEVTAPTSSE